MPLNPIFVITATRHSSGTGSASSCWTHKPSSVLYSRMMARCFDIGDQLWTGVEQREVIKLAIAPLGQARTLGFVQATPGDHSQSDRNAIHDFVARHIVRHVAVQLEVGSDFSSLPRCTFYGVALSYVVYTGYLRSSLLLEYLLTIKDRHMSVARLKVLTT